tara:strand:- start:254 stop:484 length:231 start_codon:yes stop_codon:yes gene_type:complete
MGFWTKIPQVITGVKALSKTGGRSVGEWQLKAAKAKKDAAKFNLEQTFKKTDKELKKLTETTKKNRKSLRNYLLNK